jgi:transcriptional regulator with XRE-family HTH domain
MGIRKIFAANLRRARQSAGFSQEELAFRAELDRTYISSLERGIYSATIDVVARLAEALEIEPVDLLERPKRARSR